MEPVKIGLQFEDKGFGITRFIQKIELDTTLELTLIVSENSFRNIKSVKE